MTLPAGWVRRTEMDPGRFACAWEAPDGRVAYLWPGIDPGTLEPGRLILVGTAPGQKVLPGG